MGSRKRGSQDYDGIRGDGGCMHRGKREHTHATGRTRRAGNKQSASNGSSW